MPKARQVRGWTNAAATSATERTLQPAQVDVQSLDEPHEHGGEPHELPQHPLNVDNSRKKSDLPHNGMITQTLR
ncbi:hypothetical protein GCM10022224_077150 [Nonomuraea antimicrobica]|uniref:Uncharacterized protein n=1 Tax=Nonomuraea antimicrobica TaxID=561173 RepID=A0ABP7D2C1_9ACTN